MEIKQGSDHPNWRGGKKFKKGYVYILQRNHHLADNYGYIRENILIAEKILGKPLPESAVVHHANEDGSDNRKENLVICQDRAYHNLLHQRMRALKACGHANWRKCNICKVYDNPKNLSINKAVYHQECKHKYNKLYYERTKIMASVAP